MTSKKINETGYNAGTAIPFSAFHQEDNFKNFFDAFNDMVVISTLDGTVIYVNHALVGITGYTRKEIFAMNILAFHLPHQQEEAQVIFSEMLSGKRVACNLPIQDKNGKVIPVETKVMFGTWNGESCIYSLVRDLSRQVEVEKEMKRLKDMQDMMMDLAAEFINLPVHKIDDAIQSSLERMGKFVDADRVYIFDYDFKKEVTSNLYEWCAKGISAEIDNLQNITFSDAAIWLDHHLNGREIVIDRLEDYQSDDETGAILAAQGIKSLLTVPMMHDGECVGFVGFDSVTGYHHYTEDEIKILKLFIQMLVNVQRRKQKENQLNQLIEEKIMLMKEIHHRVKNNLQIVSGLLFLQGSYSENEEIRKAMTESEKRVKAMALLHQNIYQTQDLVDFNFQVYIAQIANQIADQFNHARNIHLITELEHIVVDPDRAMLIGLIVNELLTNAYRHGYKNNDQGEVLLQIKMLQNTTIHLIVEDRGKGFDDHERYKMGSIGMQLIDAMTRQLNGVIHIKSEVGQGTTFTITMPMNKDVKSGGMIK